MRRSTGVPDPSSETNDLDKQYDPLISPHSAHANAIVAAFGIDPARGLSASEADERLRKEGFNQLRETNANPIWRILLKQFSSIVVWLLIFAAIAAFLTESSLEGFAIVVVLLINALTGFAIEWQADRSLQSLRKATRVTARVRREGYVQTVDSAEIVRGDVVVLAAGDRVPADARLVDSASLSTNESTLTGESLAVEKSVDPVSEVAPIAEHKSMVFLGTSVLTGRAVAIVTATGSRTQLGRIGKLLEHAPERDTPLERRLADLGRRLVYIVLGIGAVVLLAGLIRGEPFWLMIEVSISLAVAAVPEGLPAVTTLILAVGLLRMARRSAIVRRLAAVETLGSTTVICTDKTGTLTENRLSAQEIFLSSGKKISVRDEIGKGPTKDELLVRLLRVGLLCNEAAFHSIDSQSVADPTEAALIAVAHQAGLEIESELNELRVIKDLPFSPIAKKMTVAFEDRAGHSLAMLKGAPSVVLTACQTFVDREYSSIRLTEEIRKAFLEINENMAGRALRVLAFADKRLASNGEDLDGGYAFLGFVAMADPPRRGAADAIRKAKAAGIRVVMLTGDQMLTANAIARQLGLSDDHDIVALHSRDLTEADESRYTELARQAHVFARVTPEDKLKIVKALQRDGEIVAVTGDGVNDAPALKQADIGIAFGERGTDVAKEASDIVLTDDNFSTIVNAIENGRTIYANIVRFVHLMFSQNLGEIVVILGAFIVGLPLPLFPLQILWLNLVTDVFPALALAMEPSTPATMRRKPRPPTETLLSARFMTLIAWQGAMLALIALSAYFWALRSYGEGDHARTIALFSLVAVQLGHLFNCRSQTLTTFRRFFSNPYMFLAVAIVVVLQLIALWYAPLSHILGLSMLSLQDLAAIGITFLLPITVVEIFKLQWTLGSETSVNE